MEKEKIVLFERRKFFATSVGIQSFESLQVNDFFDYYPFLTIKIQSNTHSQWFPSSIKRNAIFEYLDAVFAHL